MNTQKLCELCNDRPVATSKKNGKRYPRKQCSRCLSKAYNLKNPENRRAIQKRYYAQYKKDNADWKQQMMDHKGQHSCLHCGESDPIVLCFHHRNPDEKSFGLNWAFQHYYAIDTMKKEAEKCDVLCFNCHLKSHATNPDGRNWNTKRLLLDHIEKRQCFSCGADDIRFLTFHHAENNKSFTIAKKQLCLDLDLLKMEASKCEVLCANCHHRLHVTERAAA